MARRTCTLFVGLPRVTPSKRCFSSLPSSPSPSPRVCVVGAGPSGFYAAKYLLKELPPTSRLDMVERMPVPYGLVRFGVAPDHPEVKSVMNDFSNVAEDQRFNFYGNVEVGKHLSVAQLRSLYDIVIFAYGTSEDRKLGIPGEDLKGVLGARTFVNWYNGFPDVARDKDLTSEIETALGQGGGRAVVLGQGNVALDCARILAKSASSLAMTDICDHALKVLEGNKLKDVSVVGRRGHVQAAFTIKELRELTKIDGAVCQALPSELDLGLTPASQEELEQQRPRKRIVDLIKTIAASTSTPPPPDLDPSIRTVSLRFLLLPKAIKPHPQYPDRVGSIVLERARLEGPAMSQRAQGTGETLEVPCHLVLRSIGYKSLALPDLPFDKKRSVVQNIKGRVSADGKPVAGLYCTGWAKRGPSGVINSNIIDARETVACIMEDIKSAGVVPSRLSQASHPRDPLLEVLKAKCEVVTWQGYKKIEAVEAAAGQVRGKPREKLLDVQQMLRVAQE